VKRGQKEKEIGKVSCTGKGRFICNLIQDKADQLFARLRSSSEPVALFSAGFIFLLPKLRE
jgi:hypothetical protein